MPVALTGMTTLPTFRNCLGEADGVLELRLVFVLSYLVGALVPTRAPSGSD
uniref:Uncharacterized protein n=1 Tax=Moniliophthora roreri TaxID=221103 RepID=A0A0W0FJJ7_MONRR